MSKNNPKNIINSSSSLYRYSFESSPTPTWIEDFTELYDFIQKLKKRGIKNFRKYLDKRPGVVSDCAKMIVVIDVNEAAVRLHKAKDKIELLTFIDETFTEKSYETFKDELIAVYHNKTFYESEREVKTLDGEVLDIISRYTLKLEKNKIHTNATAIVTLLDITKQKHYQNIINASSAVTFSWVTKPTIHEIFVSENVKNVFGYTVDEFLSGKIRYLDIIHPDDMDRVRNEAKYYRFNKKITNFTHKPYRVITKDKKIKWVEDRTSKHTSESNGEASFRGVIIDITDRYLANERAKTAEHIIQTSPVVAFVWKNEEGWPVEFVSGQVKELFGYSAEEFLTGKAPCYDDIIHPEDTKLAQEEAAKYSKDKKVNYFEPTPYRITTKSGEIKYVEDRTTIRRTEDGHIISFEGIIIDITDRVMANKKAKIAEEIINSGNVVAFEWVKGWKVRYVSNNVKNLFGYSAEEFTTDDFPSYDKLVYPEDVNKIKKEVKKYSADIKSNYFELTPYRIITKSGEIKYVEDRTFINRNKKGEILSYHGLVLDITPRFIAQQKLREEEDKFRNLVEQSLVGVYIIQEGKFPYVNPKLAEIFGYKQNEIINKLKVSDLVAPPDRQIVSENIRIRIEDKTKALNYSFRGYEKNKTIIQVEVYGARTIYNNKPAVIGTLIDVTKQKEAEKNLKFQANLLASVNDAVVASHDKNIKSKLNNTITYWNKGAEKLYGLKKEEVLGKNVRKIIPIKFIDSSYEKIIKSIKNHGSWTGETLQKDKYGNDKIVLLSISSILDDGKIIGTFGINRDITEMKLAEKQLIIKENALASATNGIIITDPNKKNNPIIYCNKAFEKITGYDANKLLGKNSRFLQGKDYNQPGLMKIREAMRKKKEVSAVIRNYKKDGTMFWNELSISPIFDEKGTLTHYIGISNDVTTQKIYEEKIKEQLNELKKWHDVTLGREERVLELKKEVNELLKKTGKRKKYNSV